MLIKFFPLGSNPVQSFFHVFPDSGVGVLVYANTCGGVKQEDVAKAHFELFELIADIAEYLFSNEVAAAFSGLEFECALNPL